MEINIDVKTVEDWKKHFPPAGGDKQWRDGYSAKEFAKIVIKNDFEKKLRLVFGNGFKISPYEIYPERLSRFDEYGGPRHHDLACCAELNGKRIVLCFEAKVNESLDKKLENYRYKGSENQLSRCDGLCDVFFGSKYEEKYKNVYFQILSSIAGTIAFAAENNVEDAYFVLFQIIPNANSNTSNAKQEHINALNEFIKHVKSSPNKRIEKSDDIVNIGKLSIPRKDEKNQPMTANVFIVYIETE